MKNNGWAIMNCEHKIKNSWRCYFESDKATRGQCRGQIRRQRLPVATSFPLSSPHELKQVAAETLRLLLTGKVQTHLARLQHTQRQRWVPVWHKAHFPRPKAGSFPHGPQPNSGARPVRYRRHLPASTYLMVCCRLSRCAHRPTRLLHK